MNWTKTFTRGQGQCTIAFATKYGCARCGSTLSTGHWCPVCNRKMAQAIIWTAKVGKKRVASGIDHESFSAAACHEHAEDIVQATLPDRYFEMPVRIDVRTARKNKSLWHFAIETLDK